jgi:hypothetical protein
VEISQGEAQSILPPFRSKILEVITSAWTDYQTKYIHVSSVHTPTCRAAIIRDHMVLHARRLFQDMKGAQIIEKGGLFLVELQNLGKTVILRFKKHTKDERTSNYPTEQAQSYQAQQTLPFMPKEAARLDAGWQPNLLFTDFRALISHPRGIGLDPWWVMDLLAPATTSDIPSGTQLPIPEKRKSETKKRVRVKPKPIKKITELNNE